MRPAIKAGLIKSGVAVPSGHVLKQLDSRAVESMSTAVELPNSLRESRQSASTSTLAEIFDSIPGHPDHLCWGLAR